MSDIFQSLGLSASGMTAQANRLRHVSENLANADTPGYKALDLDFDAALRHAQGQGGNPLKTTDGQHFASSNDGLNPFQLVRPGLQPNLDGNTVDGDVERAAYGRAALEYRASMGFVESKVRSMLTAITGQ